MESLEDVFRGALEIEESEDVYSLRYGIFPTWDSVGHMVLVAALEKNFGAKLTMGQILDIETFDDAKRLLISQGLLGE